MKKFPVILGKSDIAERWGIPQQALTYKSKNDKDFPLPIATIHNGRTPLYSEDDIKAYEQRKAKQEAKKQQKEGIANDN